MPEGPELRLNSQFVNRTGQGRVFTGGVVKSTVSKCCDVDFKSPRYAITSEARGKELALVLQCLEDPNNRTRLLFRFGMSGRFRFTLASEIPKHAHLQFFTDEQPPNVLSFIDVRRFGSWQVMDGWGRRGVQIPCTSMRIFVGMSSIIWRTQASTGQFVKSCSTKSTSTV